MAHQIELVNLYYVGGLPGEPGKQFVAARQTAFTVPPVGQHVQVRRYVADDVIRRYPDNFTLNPKRAKQLTGGRREVYQSPAALVESLSIEQLQELIALKQAQAVTPEDIAAEKRKHDDEEIVAAGEAAVEQGPSEEATVYIAPQTGTPDDDFDPEDVSGDEDTVANTVPSSPLKMRQASKSSPQRAGKRGR